MIWVAAVLAVFLFYKFVERKHKIKFIKFCGLGLAIISIGAGLFYGYESWSSNRNKDLLKVRYIYKAAKNKNAIPSLIDTNVNTFKIAKSYFTDLNQSNEGLIKNHIFSEYHKDDPFKEMLELITDEEIEAGTLVSDKVKDERRQEELENVRLQKTLAMYGRNKTKYNDFEKASFLFLMNNLCQLPSSQKVLSKTLSPVEKRLIEMFRSLREEALQDFYSVFNNSNELSVFSFEVCNNDEKILEYYTFEVSGFESSRSTARPINDTISSSTALNGDIFIKPKSCEVIEWTGKYKFYDRYTVMNPVGRWTKE